MRSDGVVAQENFSKKFALNPSSKKFYLKGLSQRKENRIEAYGEAA
jgi:hypothetical protein